MRLKERSVNWILKPPNVRYPAEKQTEFFEESVKQHNYAEMLFQKIFWHKK